MKIDLFLNGIQVEIDKDIDFVLNKQFTELTDLTSIIVDYSKTIKVPMTPRNNDLFNYVYHIEHQVLINEDTVSYDPSQKIPMTMTFNGSMVMEGYAVLNSVNLRDKTYEVNLYGQLGKIFSDLKEKPLKDYIPGSNGWWKSIRMNTKTIKDSFLHYYHSLDWTSTDWTDFWGYAPQMMGNTDDIDTKTYEVRGTGEVKNFVDVLNTTRGITYGDIYIGDGLDVNQYQEIRTYMTRPYVYVDKIIQLVKNEIDNGDYDGYQLVLDSDWFNNENPYYKDLCYFPGNESLVDNGEGVNGTLTWNNTERSVNFPMSFRPAVSQNNLDSYTYVAGSNYLITIENSTAGAESTATITLNCDGIVVRDRVTGVGSTSGFNSNGKWAFYNLPDPQVVPLRYIGIYDSRDQLLYKLYLCDNTVHSVYKDVGFLRYSWAHYSMGGAWNTLKKMSTKNIVPNSCSWVNSSVNNSYCEVTQTYNFGNIVLNTNSFRFKMGCDKIRLNTGELVQENISSSDYHTLCPFKNDKYKDEVWNNGATWSSYFNPIQSLSVTSNIYRSGSIWTIQDVLGNDFNPFTWLIDYVKKFRLFFDIDYVTKTITLKGNYFENVTYNNVIVDYSKEVIVEPIVDKYNRVDYGYKGSNSSKSIKYFKNNGVAYGDMEIDTLININNEKMSLTPNEEEGVFIPVKLDALYWTNLNSTNPIKRSNPIYTNRMINTLDKDGKIEYYPFYAFRWANASDPQQSSNPFYWLSDDTPNQKNTGKYCYLDRNSNWDSEVETTQDGVDVHYLEPMTLIPQFDNYVRRTVYLSDAPYSPNHAPSSVVVDGESEEGNYITPVIDSETEEDDIVESTYTDPMTGRTRVVRRTRDNVTTSSDDPQTYLFWVSFGVPTEVYNGYLPSNVDSYCVYNRWKSYLNEIFNVHNKKVTCYVRMSYPEFINFKFNQLFVIDNCPFLVNKIIDFNPNSTEPTKVELIQISDVNNLK